MPQKQSADSKQRSASPSSPTLDIVGRLRTATGLDLDLKREAADEIERLRNGAVHGRDVATLTDAERKAIKACESDYSDNDMDAGCWQIAATLRSLLERTK